MQIVLTNDEARILHDMLSDFLHDLRIEVARTEAKEFRHAMVLRQNLVERLLTQLEQETGTRASELHRPV